MLNEFNKKLLKYLIFFAKTRWKKGLSMKKRYSQLRAYYRFKEKFQLGLCVIPLVRRWLKYQLNKKQICELVRTSENFLVPVDSFNKETRHIQIKGSLDKELHWVIHRYVKRGSIAIDVGANLGFMSLLMAGTVGEEGKVIAIEPNNDLNKHFYYLMHVNRINNVELLNRVCVDEYTRFPFSVNKHDHKKSKIDSKSDSYIQSVTIDGIMDNEDAPLSFLKIDVEGFEPKVLAGAIKTISKHRPTLVFETGSHSKEEIGVMNSIFNDLRYEVVGVIHNWGVEQKSLTLGMTNKTHCNVLAIPESI